MSRFSHKLDGTFNYIIMVCRKHSPNWKGGKYKQNGRWLIYSPYHPFSNKHGYMVQSRLVAEECLGRYLEKDERIHHINENTLDDRPKNLFIFYSIGNHTKYHRKDKRELKSNLIL